MFIILFLTVFFLSAILFTERPGIKRTSESFAAGTDQPLGDTRLVPIIRTSKEVIIINITLFQKSIAVCF